MSEVSAKATRLILDLERAAHRAGRGVGSGHDEQDAEAALASYIAGLEEGGDENHYGPDLRLTCAECGSERWLASEAPVDGHWTQEEVLDAFEHLREASSAAIHRTVRHILARRSITEGGDDE